MTRIWGVEVLPPNANRDYICIYIGSWYHRVPDFAQDKRSIQKLRREVEKTKRALSSTHQARLEIEALYDGHLEEIRDGTRAMAGR